MKRTKTENHLADAAGILLSAANLLAIAVLATSGAANAANAAKDAIDADTNEN